MLILVTLTKRSVDVMAVSRGGGGGREADSVLQGPVAIIPHGSMIVSVFLGEHFKGVPFLFIKREMGI